MLVRVGICEFVFSSFCRYLGQRQQNFLLFFFY